MLASVLLGSCLALPVLGQAPAQQGIGELDLVGKVFDFIKARALLEVPASNLIRGAIRGMIESLGDPYSQYLEPQAWEALIERLDGKFSGIGAVITARDGYVTVVAPIKGTPAERAGLLPNDRIVEVDGQDMVGAAAEEAVHRLRGPEGSTVRVTLVRPGTGERMEVAIQREIIVIPTVEARLLEPGIGYIQISMFGEETAAEFARELAALEAAGIRSLVIDLRNNGGGVVDQGVKVAEWFVPEGPVTYVINRAGDRESFLSQTPAWNRPVVVLVNEGTASASEIVAGALQDWQTATIVGQKTFGKSTVQSIIPLPGHGGMRVTVAEYVTPLGRSLRLVGITPDIVVPAVLERSGPDRELGRGDVGDDVVWLQQALLDLGYDAGPVDGRFGPLTEQALSAWQRAGQRTVSGQLSTGDIAALVQALPQEPGDPQLDAAVSLLRNRL